MGNMILTKLYTWGEFSACKCKCLLRYMETRSKQSKSGNENHEKSKQKNNLCNDGDNAPVIEPPPRAWRRHSLSQSVKASEVAGHRGKNTEWSPRSLVLSCTNQSPLCRIGCDSLSYKILSPHLIHEAKTGKSQAWRVWKCDQTLGCALFFNFRSGCLETWSNSRASVWYITSKRGNVNVSYADNLCQMFKLPSGTEVRPLTN